MDWIDLAQDRDRGRVLCSNELSVSIKFGEFFLTSCEPVSFSRRTLLH